MNYFKKKGIPIFDTLQFKMRFTIFIVCPQENMEELKTRMYEKDWAMQIVQHSGAQLSWCTVIVIYGNCSDDW